MYCIYIYTYIYIHIYIYTYTYTIYIHVILYTQSIQYIITTNYHLAYLLSTWLAPCWLATEHRRLFQPDAQRQRRKSRCSAGRALFRGCRIGIGGAYIQGPALVDPMVLPAYGYHMLSHVITITIITRNWDAHPSINEYSEFEVGLRLGVCRLASNAWRVGPTKTTHTCLTNMVILAI